MENQTAAEQHRTLGNRRFAEKQFQSAISAYTDALVCWHRATGRIQLRRLDPLTWQKWRQQEQQAEGGRGSAFGRSLSTLLAPVSGACLGLRRTDSDFDDDEAEVPDERTGGLQDKRNVTARPATAPTQVSEINPRHELKHHHSDANLEVNNHHTDDDVFQPHVLYSNRSAAHLHLQQYERAMGDARLAIQLRPQWAKGHYRLAEVLLAKRDFQAAIDTYQVAIDKQEKRDSSTTIMEKRIQYARYQLEDQSMDLRIVQLLAGRDFAVSSWSPITKLIFNFARMLQNFIYIIACEKTKKCVLVDCCWDVDGVLKVVEEEYGYTVVGTIVTHYHFDHVGGKPPKPYDSYRVKVDGLAKVLRKYPHIRAYIHSADIPGVNEANDISADRIEPTYDNFELKVGESVNIRFIHTPGHTPGSQCLLVNGKRLLSGDTLFIGNVGRLDFPDSNVEQMFNSMQKLKELDDEIMVYAGHDYGGPFTSIAQEKRANPVMRSRSLAEFTMATAAGAE